MNNQDQNTVNPEENVVNSTEENAVIATEEDVVSTSEEKSNDIVEKPTEGTQVVDLLKDETKRRTYSEEIISTKDEEDTEEEEEEEDSTESIDEINLQYSKMTRQELLAEIKELSGSENIQKIKLRASLVRNSFRNLTNDLIKEIKDKFIAEGGVEEEFKPEEDDINLEFYKYYSIYRQKRKDFLEQQEKIKLDNVTKKNAVLDDLRKLLSSDESLKDIYDKFNGIQDKWREIGQVPRTEVNLLWQNYHFLIEKFYDKVKINRELRDLDLKRNLDAKMELCERAEELILEPSINKSFKALQELHQEWKSIGNVPIDKNDEVWERFRDASDNINKKRKDYYETMRVELESNLLAKQALCEKAEEVMKREHTNPNEWNDSTNEMNDMLNLWKSIGPVPQKDNEGIWNRFKSTLNLFFDAKKEVFAKLKEERDINYNKKVELCLKAESIAERNDWRSATREILDIQKEWKTIGYVPKKLSDKLWVRFRAACDKFFDSKSAFYMDNRAKETENLVKKEKLIKEVIEYKSGENKDESLNALKDFQRRWSAIEYVPIAEKERLQKEFRNAINNHFEKLDIDVREFQISTYKDRVVHNGNNRMISNEKRFLQDKIRKLKEDLTLWENNIGFLANSKQADILKKEFEDKMENTRKDIALSEAKLKVLDSQES